MGRPEELARLVQVDHTDEISALEETLLARILGGLAAKFEQLTGRSLKAWTVAFGSPDAPAVPGAALTRLLASVRAAVRRLVGDLGSRAATALTDTLPSIAAAAAQQGSAFVRAAAGHTARQATPRIPGRLKARATTMRDAADERVRGSLAALRARTVRRWSDVATGIGHARAAVSTVEQHVATAVNEVVNETLATTVRMVGEMRLWIAEADACVTCSAYSGLVVDIDAAFPGGLSWDPVQRVASAPAVISPPVHPRCRCRVLPWSARWETGAVPLPLHLQRQGRRNIAYGRARPSETRSARIRAAAELLRSGVDLPPDVRAAAQRAVRNRRFAAA
ncbi:hypothetical protein ABZ401_19345 [Streptomyces sp. NPDC005892]|uniref:hypothetical protein n=1 Tax=Streptomyces sp. NPDC005892 TaxID=3155593 RepID=UPI0034115799